jgi:phosphoribosylformimino-5-aminoimidazole carboxamide ribotide isomerase
MHCLVLACRRRAPTVAISYLNRRTVQTFGSYLQVYSHFCYDRAVLIIPVLDLKAGKAVHALRGERHHYQPVSGLLGDGHDVLALATAYRDQLGLGTCYVADLDAIAGTGNNINLLQDILKLGLALWVDAGVHRAEQALAVAKLGISKIIIGSETLRSLEQLTALTEHVPPAQLVLSVDLVNGMLRAPVGVDTPEELIVAAAGVGIQDVILLDLARVGAASGPPLELLASLQSKFPELKFYAGGGVRQRADLLALAKTGAAGALIATAFHRGTLTAADLSLDCDTN